MDLAGDILQELCSFLGINDLTSTADFPEEFRNLGDVLNDVSVGVGAVVQVIIILLL